MSFAAGIRRHFGLIHANKLSIHNKYSWAKRLRDVLAFVAANPKYAPEIGAISCGYNAVLINRDRLTKFFEFEKPNGLNRNLKQHGFEPEHPADIAAELHRCCPGLDLQVHQWSKRVFRFGPFNPGSTDEEVAVASDYRRTYRSTRKPTNSIPRPSPAVFPPNTAPQNPEKVGESLDDWIAESHWECYDFDLYNDDI
jgi:hypothetical protein